ncbi:FAD-dependent pyridine nucleotide-disulfide oxidoreductase [Rhizodiscina lignyota]|uniref:FAD-dependent pyridine nucleotide-disulfide oxidoreductase n=1 Tax=Rhizodiscina lignyota TaxID=1504668 RepID=A0A9P4I731_9PEZI|nr:FAD-dependent pyridine nucleotide-disulfide oxidoreductase [Rhizodiscina lignyota]
MSSDQSVEHYDLISLGSGEAGKFIAWTYRTEHPDSKCAVIERKWLGGSCPNIACLPSKNVIYSAKVAHEAAEGTAFGLPYMAAESKVNMKSVIARKKAMIDGPGGLMDVHKGNFKRTGAELVWGEGRFIGPKTIEVVGSDGSKRVMKGDKVVICTGSRARIDDSVKGLKESKPLTHIEMLDLEEIPRHLVVLGGGYVGVELAQAWKRFGSEVTVIEKHERILKNEDEDMVELLTDILQREGVKFSTDTTITEVTGTSGDAVILKGRTTCGASVEINASHILVAAGRTPNNDTMGAEQGGIKLTSRGFVDVDEFNRASADGVFAVGDCAGSPNFTHVAYDDFRIVRDFLSGKITPETDPQRKSGRQVPWTLFTAPEMAHVGLREHELKAQGIKYRVGKLPIAAFLRTRTLGPGETEGVAKVTVGEDDKILGFTVLGSGVGDLLPVVQLAMKLGVKYTEISNLILTHPTLSEGLVFLFSAVPERS